MIKVVVTLNVGDINRSKTALWVNMADISIQVLHQVTPLLTIVLYNFEFEWGVYALSAPKAIFRARTYNCITYSVR